MANRVLRDTTDSEPVNALTAEAEILLYRLFMKVDDFGSYHGNPSLIKTTLFPLFDGSNIYKRDNETTTTKVISWLEELERVGLIFFYESNNKKYLRVNNFKQRLRLMKSKFPEPENVTKSADNCQQTAVKCPPETRNKKLETETRNKKLETETVNVNFETFWDLYDKKVGDKNQLLKKWLNLTDGERVKIMEHVPLYKIAQPEKKYRKDPQTYLNNKSWNDEIINHNGTKNGNHNINKTGIDALNDAADRVLQSFSTDLTS